MVDFVLEIQTEGNKMEGIDGSIELRRLPMSLFTVLVLLTTSAIKPKRSYVVLNLCSGLSTN